MTTEPTIKASVAAAEKLFQDIWTALDVRKRLMVVSMLAEALATARETGAKEEREACERALEVVKTQCATDMEGEFWIVGECLKAIRTRGKP